MSDRLRCIVPYCRRTTKAEFREWVCAKHWTVVPKALRRAYRTAMRRARKIVGRRPEYREYWKLRPGSPERLSAVAMWRRVDGCWERCKRAAIEAAVGI